MRVGLALPVAEQPDRGGAALSYRELRGFALLAEDAGLDFDLAGRPPLLPAAGRADRLGR
jgi:hypothetical protein